MRYHFHVVSGGEVVLDDEGVELGGEDVRDVALKGARSLIIEDVRLGRIDLSGRIDVVDEYGRAVMVLPFRDAVEMREDRANQIG